MNVCNINVIPKIIIKFSYNIYNRILETKNKLQTISTIFELKVVFLKFSNVCVFFI